MLKRFLSTAVLVFLLPALIAAQERIKFPVGVSSKILGYAQLWAAWRQGFFDREGLDVDVVLIRGTVPAVQALIVGSIYAGLVANDGPIAAVEQGMDLALVAAGSKITHMIIGGKNYKTYEDLRGTTIGSSTVTSGTAFVLRRVLKGKGLEYPQLRWNFWPGNFSSSPPSPKGDSTITLQTRRGSRISPSTWMD